MESVSTLMDGELDGDEAAQEIARFKQDPARRDSWNTYHTIGDAMRGEHLRTSVTPDFSKRLSERLAAEPTVLAPRMRVSNIKPAWAMAIAASVAAFAAVGVITVNMLNPDASSNSQLARAPAFQPPVVALQPAEPIKVEPVAAAAEHMHEYLLAHQGISPSTAIQGVTPYIRTVSNVGNDSGLR